MEKKLKYLFKTKIYDLYIIRHPEVENYKDNVFNGTVDVDLSPHGYKQAQNLYEFFKDKNIKTVFSSPMKRCRAVAELFENNCQVTYNQNLKERNFGIFESLRWSDIEAQYPEQANNFLKNPFVYRVKNGESFLDVRTRVLSFMNEILPIKTNTLIIAHGGINRVFISHFLEMNLNAILKISQDYSCINHFQTDGSFVLCKLINGDLNCK